MKAIERLEEYRKHKGWSFAEAERELGMSNGYFAKQLNRKSDLGESVMTKVLESSPDLSPVWLLVGEGEMLRSTTIDSHQIQQVYHPMSAEKIIEEQYVPYFSFEATAGIMENLDDSPEFEIGKIVVPNMPRCDGAVSITGDSMYPLLKSGDIVAFQLVQDINNIHYGDMYLISLNEDGDTYITVKWVNKHPTDPSKAILMSYNSYYAPREVELRHIHRIALIKFSIRYNSMG